MFREDFAWGAGSSAYQIEGAATADGKGLSVWDAFCHTPGKVHRDEHGDVACDHYTRFGDDVKLMQRIGLKAYRFSINWPRVLPTGRADRISEPGLAFYDRLVDSLLEAGIDPWVTLFHWEFPQELYLEGGWLNPESPRWFADYTKVVVDRLSDRVTKWLTLNEPQIFLGLGHMTGIHAPGLKLPFSEVLLATHHALLAHGRAVDVIRGVAKKKPVVGWAPVGRVDFPASDTRADIDAARARMFSIHSKDCWNNTWFYDPAVLGGYPEDGLKLFGADAPRFTSAEMDQIKRPLDLLGVNIYSGERYKAAATNAAAGSTPAQHVPWPAGHPRQAMNWPVAPGALYWGPRFLNERYKLPIVVTENGMSNLDWVQADGRVHDTQRIDFTRAYLRELRRATGDGVDLRGYFHWSIMDNFEWAEGFKERFGLIHVDYATLKRTLKDSALWYGEVIRTNGDHLDASESTVIELTPAKRPAPVA